MLNRRIKEYFSAPGTVSRWWNPTKTITYIIQFFKVIYFINPKDKIIADIGTGKGRYAIRFARRGARKVYALDISEEMLEIAKINAKKKNVADKIIFLKGDIDTYRFEENYFDIVCCMELFAHLLSPQAAINKLAKIAKPGGLIVANIDVPIPYFITKYIFHTFYWSYRTEDWLYPIYFSRFFEKPRHLLAALFGFRKKAYYEYDPKYRFINYWLLKSTDETLAFHKKYPEAYLGPSPDIVGKMNKKDFKNLFINARLDIIRVLIEGNPLFPKGHVVFARKRKTGSNDKN